MNLRTCSTAIAMVVLLGSLLQFVRGECEDYWTSCTKFKPLCNSSFVLLNCLKTCNACAIDICSVENGGCDHICVREGDASVCSCLPGYRLGSDSHRCQDINECTEGTNPCPPLSGYYCLNTLGSFQCVESFCSNQTGMTNRYRSDGCCKAQDIECGTNINIRRAIPLLSNESSVSRISSGWNAAGGQWPWQAQITFNHESHCGATILTSKWLVSAAHCFSESAISRMFVYMGHVINAIYDRTGTQRRIQRRIARVVMHENYDNYSSDIALVEMDQPITFNEYVSPICLPCGEETEPITTKCWATGFGSTADGRRDAFPEYLQEVDLPIVEGNTCVDAYRGTYSIDKTTMLCAGYERGQKDACQGDSGGPLVCQRSDSCDWYLAGITSFGVGCGLPGYYGVYVNVVHFEGWIKSTLGIDEFSHCERLRQPCNGLTNVDYDCYEKLHFCLSYSHYMDAKCGLACCQLKNKEISICFDTPGSASFCQLQRAFGCTNPVLQRIINLHCKKTCNLC